MFAVIRHYNFDQKDSAEIELVAFVDVDVAHVLVLGLAPGGTGRSDVPRKNATLTVLREADGS